ncbi:MAG: hypothetical protein LUQ59_10730 [Methanothrix sp.]|nr:hypothetical protein [Methanothrix sp.]
MAVTATDITREHYLRPEVREIISRFALPGNGTWRALNGDFHRWYRNSTDGRARLLNVCEDYEELVNTYRTLYQTLNVFDPSLWMASRPREEITSDNPLGTPADTAAYEASTDIDKGHGYDIEDPEVKKAVEAAAQFLVDYLKERGIRESVWVLFSGGGAYVKIHHEICRPRSSATEDRRAFFEELTERYNRLIAHVSDEFFKAHPEYIGKVKYDALNNSKRVFKCILSIHKKKPYAVTPLNRDAVKIDFERARVPLQEDMIAEARAWYSTYDPAEREPLLQLLDEFKETEEEKKRLGRQFKETWRSSTKADQEDFPPCIKHIVDTANLGEGKTRFSAVLSTFLYQMGWDDEEAWGLVKAVSDRNGLGNADHIFDSCFGRISCPSCQTIQDDGAGYPHLGLKGLGACRPDERCHKWPGDYGVIDFFEKIGSSNAAGVAAEIPVLTLEQFTKATGKMEQIDPDTGDIVLDEEGSAVIIAKRVLSPSKASKTIGDSMMLRISETDTSDNGKIWRYDGGIWRPDGEKEIKKTIDDAIGDLSYEKGLRETLRRIRSRTDLASFDSNPYLFPTKDGVVDLATGAFRAAMPEDYLTFRYGAEFNNSEADFRPFLWFLCSSLPDPRDVLTALDIITAVAIRVPFDVIVLLFGGGGNGKGIFEKVILALFTMARATAVKLEEMKRSRFGPGALLNKDLWLVTEVETIKDAMSVLKAESTGEMIDVDVKYGERIQGMPHAVPILDANNAFDFGDNSYGRKRRVAKLDFPYTFGDAEGMRPIDRHLKDKLRSPEILAGIARIIAARAPAMIESRRIYRRKSTEEQEDEFKRQQFHLATFFDDCIGTTWPYTERDPEGATPKKLKVDEAHKAYLEYCRLFNVTTPADKVPFGRYISERYGIQSVNTSEAVKGNRIDYRYYPGLFLIKSAIACKAESKLSFNDKYDTPKTDLRQIWGIGNDSCKDSPTDPTDKVLFGVTSEIEGMFKFILSCQDERGISYENYLKISVGAVGVVGGRQRIANYSPATCRRSVVGPVGDEKPKGADADPVGGEEHRTAKGNLSQTPLTSRPIESAEEELVSDDPGTPPRTKTIEAELQQAKEARAAEEAHDRELVEKYSGTSPTDRPDSAEGGPTNQARVSSNVSTDQPCVSNDRPDSCGNGSTNQAGVSRRPEAKHSKLDPTALERVRIIKPEGYRTQIPHPENPNKFVDHLYSAGEIVEIQHWKAKDLIERHIAEPVGRAEA